jgi:Protein of unknown function DUF262
MDRVDYQALRVQDLVTWKGNDELDLAPWYQRRAVWTLPQKSYLINTLFECKPIPTLYFRHSIDLEADKSLREVVDGQQRIRSILEYISNDYATSHPEHDKKVHHKDLSNEQKRKFRETQLSGAWLLGATDQDVIEVFGRLNSVAKTLNAAEKRNAEFSGEFKQFCLKQAASRVMFWRDLGIFSANDIARMQEIQFIGDIVLNLLDGLSDYSAPKLDRIYAKYDDKFSSARTIEKRLNRCFELIAALPRTVISDTIFSRQPLFFSLLLVLDSLPHAPSTKALQSALNEIDERFNSDVPINERTKQDAEFYEACQASTQRIATRKIRHRYIEKFLK